MATPEFRLIREHTRYRRDLTAGRTREMQRVEKLLEAAAMKLSSVLTDLHGVTGRDIMRGLIARSSDRLPMAARVAVVSSVKPASATVRMIPAFPPPPPLP